MKAYDFKITAGPIRLTAEERADGMRAAQAALDAGRDREAAELAACEAAFLGWYCWPEAVELVTDGR